MSFRPRAALHATAIVVVACAWLVLPTGAHAGQFVVGCGFSHRMRDDPVVKPHLPGGSHWHDFYGSSDANADSSASTMRAAPTTCTSAGDRAGYWHPTLYVDRKPVRGTSIAYYRSRRAMARRMRPFPPGLKVVVGDAHAAGPQKASIVFWRCVGNGSTRRFRWVPRCTSSTRLAAYVLYPDCWNGTQLDSADHRSHMAYSRRGACPASHPVVVPRLVMRFEWNIRPLPRQVTLSSGAAHTFHADFWNTWRQRRLHRLTRLCLNAHRNCGMIRR